MKNVRNVLAFTGIVAILSVLFIGAYSQTGVRESTVKSGVGGLYTGFPDSDLETVSVTSSSASDASAGTGARTIRVTGLDVNYNVLAETITLNGTTPASSVSQFRRIHTAMIITAGSGGVNAGTITCNHTTTTGNVFFVMQIGANQTNESAYTVPAGYTAYLRQIGFSGVYRQRRPSSVNTNSNLRDNIYGGLIFTEKSDLVLRSSAVSANNTQIYGGYDLVLVKN